MLSAVIVLLAVSIPIGRMPGTLLVRQLRLQEEVVSAPVVRDALRALLERLRGSGAIIPCDVQVIVVASATVNALTLPGDVITVDSGLLVRMATLEEMAAVLAHEIGHVVNHDPFKLLAQRLDPWCATSIPIRTSKRASRPRGRPRGSCA